MRQKMIHKVRSLKEKKAILSKLWSGRSITSLSKEYYTNTTEIQLLVERYRLHGMKGLEKSMLPNKFSYKEKIRILRECDKSFVILPKLSVKYGVSIPTIRHWRRQYESGELQAMKSTQIRKTTRKPVKEILKEDDPVMQELLSLRKENECLKLQIDILKKVKALLEKQETGERKRWQKSSSH